MEAEGQMTVKLWGLALHLRTYQGWFKRVFITVFNEDGYREYHRCDISLN